MKPFNPHTHSQKLRRFKPTRKPSGIFSVSIVFSDASLLLLAFFLAISPFIMQPGINIRLPASPFVGGARFDSLVLSITHDGRFYFNDERLDEAQLTKALEEAAAKDSHATLIVEADVRVPYGAVISAWNAALSAGISEVSIATRNSLGKGKR